MSVLRIFALIFVTFFIASQTAWAQSGALQPGDEATIIAAEQMEAKRLENAAIAEAAEQSAPSKAVSPPAIDFDDPAVIAAIEAREEAEKALSDAVRKQLERSKASQAAKDNIDTPKKPSIIPSNAEEVKVLFRKIGDKLLGWLTSITFLAQLGAIIAAYILSTLIARVLRKRISLFHTPPAEDVKLKAIRDKIFLLNKLLRPILLVVLLILFGIILKALSLGGSEAGSAAASTWLVKIAQSLAVVFLLFKAIKEFIGNDLIQKLAIWTAIPLALIMLFGYYDDLLAALNGVELMKMGDTPISLMTVILLLIFGSIFFKLGNIANSKGQRAIRSQDGLDVATQEVVGKIFQIILFTIVFILVMGAAKIPLSGLVVIFSALSLGVGLGLQPIAANFVSGMIILFDRSVRAGDYVVLPDGQEGFVEAINLRNTIVETTDGKDIMVPNTKFTEDAYENWTHKDPRQRYEVHFKVGYDTDLDSLEDILMPVFENHPLVLDEPEMPDLEFREFGEYGAHMAVEFWCSGIDDGPNKFTSDLNFAVWRALRDNKITIPYPKLELLKK